MFSLQWMKMKTVEIRNVIRIQLCTSKCEVSLSHPALSFLTFIIALLTLGFSDDGNLWGFIPNLPCSHSGIFPLISSLFYCYFSIPTKTFIWMVTTLLLKYWNIFCLAYIFHFLPQIIFVHLSCLGQTALQPRTCTRLLAHSSGRPCFFHSIQKFWFYLLWSCRQTFCGISSYFFILHPSVISVPPVLFFRPCPSCKTQKTAAAEERSG